jgi:hypothetical protein
VGLPPEPVPRYGRLDRSLSMLKVAGAEQPQRGLRPCLRGTKPSGSGAPASPPLLGGGRPRGPRLLDGAQKMLEPGGRAAEEAGRATEILCKPSLQVANA